MKKPGKEIIILLVQLFMFYIFPLFAGPTDAMAMVILIIEATFALSIAVGVLSRERIKYLYPPLISVLFIPSVFIYYNESALMHAFWYLVISLLGLCLGLAIRQVGMKIKNRKKNSK